MQHIGSLSEQWRELTSLLRNTKLVFEPRTDVRANELRNYFTAANIMKHFLNKSKENNTDKTSKKLVALESTTALLK